MDQVQERINKLREERVAREKARIEKLRELNLKKYKTTENTTTLKKSVSNLSISTKNVSKTADPKNIQSMNQMTKTSQTKTNFNRPHSVANFNFGKANAAKVKIVPARVDTKLVRKDNAEKIPTSIPKPTKVSPVKNVIKPPVKTLDSKIPANAASKLHRHVQSTLTKPTANKDSRKTISSTYRKSIIPTKVTQSKSETNDRQSVFDRLYKPKIVNEKRVNNVEKLHTDVKFRERIMKQSGLIINKRQSVYIPKEKIVVPVRRSISAVHLKRIGKNELPNCFHKWSSIGEKLNEVHIQDVNEDDKIKEDCIMSAVKSERKKVKFQRPISMNFNTPKPAELQARLQHWLQKRGKSLHSYHHLQCFGLHHLAANEKEFRPYDDEDKENIAVESDSDNDSYCDNLNNKPQVEEKWRRASFATEFDETKESISSEEVALHNANELLLGALSDVTDLLREGFDWQQCARWLRAIRERFPTVCEHAAYWECRAALEEAQGNLPASVQCWEEAIAKGTERSVVEANLDNLLDKFMQLKISPQSTKKVSVNPKMLDVKNVFKSTIIRFAVQQAKLRQSMQPENASKYIITPVRRSTRVSCYTPSTYHTPRAQRTPLVQICDSIRHIDSEFAKDARFVRNETIPHTP